MPPTRESQIEDRHAVGDVQDAIQNGVGYMLVYERDAADLVILVGTARVLEGRGGVAIGQSQPSPLPPDVPIVEDDRQQDVMGSGQDLLAVYAAGESLDSAPLWQERGAHGLKPPEIRLVTDFRRTVDTAAQQP